MIASQTVVSVWFSFDNYDRDDDDWDCSCYNDYSFWGFLIMNRLALFHHLVFYPVSVSTFAFWNILGHDLLVPEIAMSLLLFSSHFKHLDLLPKCGYLHTAGQGLPSLRR